MAQNHVYKIVILNKDGRDADIILDQYLKKLALKNKKSKILEKKVIFSNYQDFKIFFLIYLKILLF